MTPEEFKSLKTGTKDPITPEKLMVAALWRLDDLEKMKKRGRTDNDPRKTDEQWAFSIDQRIDEVCYLLSVHRFDGGHIEPTHYCGAGN
jgi:hypothetical protein